MVVDLAQIRALADPLRLRILGQLVTTARTTKQVAERLGEKPTKLYHHVQALERVGLVRLVDTRPKRGTVEKYYQSVATVFQVGPGVFAPGMAADLRSSREAVVVALLDTAREDLAAHLATDDADPVVGLHLMLTPSSRASCATTLRHLQRMLGRASRGRKYALTAVLCPVPKSE